MRHSLCVLEPMECTAHVWCHNIGKVKKGRERQTNIQIFEDH